MPVRKISVSLDEDVLERATEVAEREGVSLSTWLSRAAAEAADIATKQDAWVEFRARYGEPSNEDKQRAREELQEAGFFEPESPEEFAQRMAALANLRDARQDADDTEEDEPESRARRAG